MMKKVVEAKVGNSITRYEDLWLLKLECGHTLSASRRPSNANKAPTKKDCRECNKDIETVDGDMDAHYADC
jgi:hypothetical protein